MTSEWAYLAKLREAEFGINLKGASAPFCMTAPMPPSSCIAAGSGLHLKDCENGIFRQGERNRQATCFYGVLPE